MTTVRHAAVAATTAFIAVLVLAPVGRSAETQNWPGFRGPSASGVADGQNLPDTWNGVTGTNIRWKVEVPGLAHSSAIVWDNRIEHLTDPAEWFRRAAALSRRSGRPVLLISNREVPGREGFRLKVKFTDSLIADEQFFLYARD